MRLSKTQKDILTSIGAGATAKTMAEKLGSRPGPIARSMISLKGKGFLDAESTKAGDTRYLLTADGKAARRG
ncbi:MAG: hypothetical protein MUC88_00235 [Planctomycetes bacterium]|jgi:hypothetical protein|nr:hypothetical protein [Planctomycetota bacterium]